MKQEETLLLQWSDFQENLSTSVGNIRAGNDFCDVTLACEDESDTVSAHRVILASGSSFFDRVLRRTSSHPQPLVFLPGLRRRHLDSILAFLYLGWARVPQEELLDFLSAARLLGVRGLESEGSEEKQVKWQVDRGPRRTNDELNEDQKSSWLSSSAGSFKEDADNISTHTKGLADLEEDENKSNTGTDSKTFLKKKYMRKSTAPIWELMVRSTENPNIAHCNLCGSKSTCIGGTTTNMVYHIKNRHPGTQEAETLELKMKEREKKSSNAQLDSLMEDMILEVGERWQCKVCAKITATRENLRKHVRTH